MKRVPMDRLIDFGKTFMTKRGMPEAHAAYLAEVIVETEAFRRSTHGLVQFLGIHKGLGTTFDPEAEPTVVRKGGAAGLVDGARCCGNLAMKVAREMAVDMASEQGVGFVAVRDSAWVGALGPHLIPIAREGYLAQAWAQTTTCKDCAPFGGIDARFSTNPIALAFPKDGDPVVADFSTATMSMSAATALAKSGATTETPRFLDKQGAPSRDPAVMQDEGTLMFMGGDTDGHKGYALSLFNEALTVLAGGSANNPEQPLHQNFGLMVLDPAAFGGRDHYEQEMRRYIDHVRSSRPRPDSDGVRLPGERGFADLADCQANGVPLDDDKLAMLKSIAEENHMEPVA